MIGIEILDQPDWATAIASGVFAAISAAITAWIAWMRMKRRFRLEDRTEAILRKLLMDRRFKRRKFETIKAFVPLSDEKLREALLRAGAVQLVDTGGDAGGEYWGLLENHHERVFPKSGRLA